MHFAEGAVAAFQCFVNLFKVHKYGGNVYMDGANMNAQLGLTSPGIDFDDFDQNFSSN